MSGSGWENSRTKGRTFVGPLLLNYGAREDWETVTQSAVDSRVINKSPNNAEQKEWNPDGNRGVTARSTKHGRQVKETHLERSYGSETEIAVQGRVFSAVSRPMRRRTTIQKFPIDWQLLFTLLW